MHEPPSTQPDLPQPGPRGRQGRPAARLSKPSQGRNQRTGHGSRSRPRSWSTERRRRPRPKGTGAGRDCGRPGPRRVRTPSKTPGPRRPAAVTTGVQNHRSHGLHRSGLGLPSSRGPGSNPSASATRTGHLRLQHPSAGTRRQGRPRAGSTTTLRRRRPIAQLLGGPGRSRTFLAASPGSAATTRRRVHPTFTRTRGAPAVTSWRLGRSPTAAA
jgi:hypothetical protein